ncbi:MAG: DnaD domain protein [Erysipelotrichaceae bacterium]|nr:DnaD domain protein [Erysipelotrichaceae bacterium]
MSDFYRCEIFYPLDEIQNDILYYLYQPLIGAPSVHLYMMLHLEGKRMKKNNSAVPLSRLLSFLSINMIDLEKQLRSLEAIGLIKTYVKHHDNLTQYIFQLMSPLSLKAFFKNQILTSLLEESLSMDDLKRTIQYFKVYHENVNDYEEVTARFQDVFTITHRQNSRKLKYSEDMPEEKTKEVVLDYDYDLFYKTLSDYQVSRKKLNKDDEKYVIQLAQVYHIDAITLAGFVKESMESTGINKQILKNKIKEYYDLDHQSSLSEVYHKQPMQYQTTAHDNSPLELHMKYLDSITPYELLKDKQGGKEPVYHDLMIVETLMNQLGLKPAVVNVLLEYVLGKNDNRLSKRYLETIGSSWTRKHIETAMDAYKELMHEDVTDDDIEVKEKPVVDNAEAKSLLDKLKGGSV